MLAALHLLIINHQRVLFLPQPVICVQLLNIGDWEIGLEVHCLVKVDNGCIDLVDKQVHLWQKFRKMNWTKSTEILDAHLTNLASVMVDVSIVRIKFHSGGKVSKTQLGILAWVLRWLFWLNGVLKEYVVILSQFKVVLWISFTLHC